MTYDDIPHLSAKIKPKQQKVGLPSDRWRRGGAIQVGVDACEAETGLLGTRSPEKERLEDLEENQSLAEPGKLRKESFQKERE